MLKTIERDIFELHVYSTKGSTFFTLRSADVQMPESSPKQVSPVIGPRIIQADTKKRELLKNPTKIEEIQEKTLLTEIEPLQLAF